MILVSVQFLDCDHMPQDMKRQVVNKAMLWDMSRCGNTKVKHIRTGYLLKFAFLAANLQLLLRDRLRNTVATPCKDKDGVNT